MPLSGNVYSVVGRTIRISRHDHRNHPHSRLDGSAPYRPIADMVAIMESDDIADRHNPLVDWHFSDALFGFTVRAHRDFLAGGDRHGGGQVLRRVLAQGIYDWGRPDRQNDGAAPSMPIRYAAVLGSELLGLIDVLEDKVFIPVSCLGVEADTGIVQ
jgi:hypothetical protein